MSADLRQLMERILALHAEEDEIKSDRKEVYAEAQTAGLNKSALGLAIRTIRARQKQETPADLTRQSEAERMVEEYDRLAHVHVREAAYPERHKRPVTDLETSKDSQARQISAPAGNGADQLVAEDPIPGTRAAFTLPIAKPLRPHCKKPDRCGSYGSRHCAACLTETNSEAA